MKTGKIQAKRNTNQTMKWYIRTIVVFSFTIDIWAVVWSTLLTNLELN